MTTSYKLEALKRLKAEKKLEREREALEFKAKEEAEAKAHQANLERIAKKMAIIEKGGVVPNPKPVVEKKSTSKKETKAEEKKPEVKKSAPKKKRGRPSGSKTKKK